MSKLLDLWDELTGVVLDYALSTPPSAKWLMCYGQPLVAGDAVTARLRAKLIADGFPHGQDAGGNPRVPDVRGRATAGKDDMGGTAAGRLTAAGGVNGAQLGATGGVQVHTLTVAQMPGHNHGVSDPGHNHAVSDPGHGHGVSDPTHAHSVYDPGHGHGVSDPGHRHSYSQANVIDGNVGNGTSHTIGDTANTGSSTTGISINAAGTGIGIYGAYTGISVQGSGTGVSIQSRATGITTQNNGAGEAHPITQPTLVLNKIIRL